ncbi:tetratricopeptide repeat protein [Francisella frigiditurris]|uniref:Sel1 repeat family protein n=1 Tax=Francisella frigiditurris TaxID=1542390 RepID=A0A1J0KRT5_9GAMM|nr:SEL1-like repeat protein [Francisella frigiditurris]APC96332.1 sel1 repeat family protein [Francisella frigiditurris]
MIIKRKKDKNPVEKKARKSLTKKQSIIVGLVILILGLGGMGVNLYLSHTHKAYLEAYAKAINDIQARKSDGYNEAFEILKELDENGKATTSDRYYLGYAYQFGLGTSINYREAYKNYNIALSQGSARAAYQLAILYMNGDGVNKDNAKARAYLVQAYKKGYKPALEQLVKLFDQNPDLIFNTDPVLLYKLFELYEKGELSSDDEDEIDTLLKAAAVQGYEPALVKQANRFNNSNEYSKALNLWKELEKSKDPEIAKNAKDNVTLITDKLSEAKATDKLNEEVQNYKQSQIAEKIINESQVRKQNTVNIINNSANKSSLNNEGLIYFYYRTINKEYFREFISKALDVNKADIELLDNNTKKSLVNIDYFKDNNTSKYISNLFTTSNKLSWDSLIDLNKSFDKNNDYYIAKISFINKFLKIRQFKNLSKKNIVTDQKDIASVATPTTTVSSIPITNKITEAETTKKVEKELTTEEKMKALKESAVKDNYVDRAKLEKEAENGKVEAIYYLGEYFYDMKEYPEAIKEFRKAAKLGYGRAYYKLANIYFDEDDDGLKYNKEKAIEYYQKAAANGVENARYILMLIQ